VNLALVYLHGGTKKRKKLRRKKRLKEKKMLKMKKKRGKH